MESDFKSIKSGDTIEYLAESGVFGASGDDFTCNTGVVLGSYKSSYRKTRVYVLTGVKAVGNIDCEIEVVFSPSLKKFIQNGVYRKGHYDEVVRPNVE
jgi:hypothetical protein